MRHRNRDYRRDSVRDKRQMSAKSDKELLSDIDHYQKFGSLNYVPTADYRLARREIERRFRVRHGATEQEFRNDHFQTLFHLEYPQINSRDKLLAR